MIRNDFVSNSSSSSYIISTSYSKKELIDFFLKNIHNGDQEYTKDFLVEKLCHYTQLIIGDFSVLGKNSSWMEQSEEFTREGLNFDGCLVENDDVKKFIENGQVKIKLEDIYGKKNNGLIYPNYKVFEITQDSIDFTRWFIQHSVNTDNNENLKKLTKINKEAEKIYTDWLQKNDGSTLTYPEELVGEHQKYKELCNGLILKPSYVHYIKNPDATDESKKWTKIIDPLEVLLDKYEKILKEGKRIYRICFGYSGEGTDWSEYIWLENFDMVHNKYSNDKINFESDPFW